MPIHEDRLPWVMSVAMNMVPRFKRENSSVYYCTVNSRKCRVDGIGKCLPALNGRTFQSR